VTAATGMSVRVAQVVMDCADLDVAVGFWSALLGMRVTQREELWVDLETFGAGGPQLCLQVVPERKTVKNRVHLDLAVADVVAAGRRARELGATEASALHRPHDAPWQVWRDPEGNEFCLVTAA
jgi:predicted enzyme related to lactoylglutathione lyase